MYRSTDKATVLNIEPTCKQQCMGSGSMFMCILETQNNQYNSAEKGDVPNSEFPFVNKRIAYFFCVSNFPDITIED